MIRIVHKEFVPDESLDLCVKTNTGSLWVYRSVLQKIDNEVIELMMKRNNVSFDFESSVVEDFIKFVRLGVDSFDGRRPLTALLKLYHFAETYHVKELIDLTAKVLSRRQVEMDCNERALWAELVTEYGGR